MKVVKFDFERIGSIADFYSIAKKQLHLPEYFGNNLDALWDCITGNISLPLSVKFVNMSMNQLEIFENLIELFEEASTELGENRLSFEYYLRSER